jgi:hypothetical protein
MDLIYERFHDAEIIKFALSSRLPLIGPPNRKDEGNEDKRSDHDSTIASILLMRIIARKTKATKTNYLTSTVLASILLMRIIARQRMIQAQIPQKRRSRK